MSIQLTPQELNAYQRDGYIVVEDLVSQEDVDALRM
ncbi:phytanoyl-CoA dioxygenase family protein [Chloroflexi bacterium TSY]|nr:phytanoyl-CoA dioxygenase family protein [Chloroflexi bacterium TSY]